MDRKILFIANPNDSQLDLVNVFSDLSRKDNLSVDIGISNDKWKTLLANNFYSVIIVNGQDGGITPSEICRTVKDAYPCSAAGIIFISPDKDDIDIVVALEVGVDSYLLSPVSPRVLLRVLLVLL